MSARRNRERSRAARQSGHSDRLRARGRRRADRARHLAARAQGLEGSADRRADAQARSRARRSPPRERWPAAHAGRTNSAASRFRRSSSPAQEALVYTSGSALRAGCDGPGYWVFAPARLAGGSIVVVNRGFVPEGKQDPKTRPAAVAASSRSSARCAGRSRAACSRPTRHAGEESLVRARSRRDGGGQGLGQPSRRSTSSRKRRAAPAACQGRAAEVRAAATTTCNTR